MSDQICLSSDQNGALVEHNYVLSRRKIICSREYYMKNNFTM